MKTKRISIQDYMKVHIDFSPKIPPLKKISDKTKINVRYSLIAPFAFAHIYWDPKISEVLYKIEEPTLTKEEETNKNDITKAMRNMINFNKILIKILKN